MMQFLWFYVRAWVWAHLPEWPRLSPALWAWLALAFGCGLSAHFHRELWPHTPGAAGISISGVALGSGVAGVLLLRDLWRWWGAWQPAWWRWAWLLVLGPLAGVALLALALLLVLLG